MTTYRMFATEYHHRSCVRIFKPEQINETIKPFLRKYCSESMPGTIVELIKYVNGKAEKCVYRVTKKI